MVTPVAVVAERGRSTALGPGVAGDVGERLLHDAVGGQLDGGRQRRGGAVAARAARRGRRPGRPRPARRGRPGGARAPRGVVAAAQHVERGAQLVERVAAGLLDVGQRRPGLLGLLVEQVQGHAGLHVDQRDVVGQHVVQLLGQPQPLLAEPAPLLVLGGLGQLGRPLPADADQLRDGQHDDQPPGDQRQVHGGRAGPVVGSTTVADDEAAVAGRGQQPRRPAMAGLHGAEQRDDDADEDRAVRVAEPDVDVGGADGHRRRRRAATGPATASAAGPSSTSTTARASIALRSGWLSRAPKVPTTWNSPTASALTHTALLDLAPIPTRYADAPGPSSARGRTGALRPRAQPATRKPRPGASSGGGASPPGARGHSPRISRTSLRSSRTSDCSVETVNSRPPTAAFMTTMSAFRSATSCLQDGRRLAFRSATSCFRSVTSALRMVTSAFRSDTSCFRITSRRAWW